MIHEKLSISYAPSTSKAPPQQALESFAQALKGVCDIPILQLPQAAIKVIHLLSPPQKKNTKHVLMNVRTIFRVLWPKGYTPLTVVALCVKLSLLWSEVKNWGMLSLGNDIMSLHFQVLRT